MAYDLGKKNDITLNFAMFCLCVNVSNWFFSAPYNKQIYAFSEKMKSPIHEYTLMK